MRTSTAACAREGEPSRLSSDENLTWVSVTSVRIVINPENSYDDAGEPWLVEETPAVVIGDVAGDAAVLFDRVMGIDRLGDGRWVVADMGSSQVRWYDPDGTPLYSAGGQGEGPQDFQQVMGMVRLAGDTLAIDDARSRVQLLDAEGEFIGILGDPGGSPFVEARTDLAGALADGTPVAVTSPTYPQRLTEDFIAGRRPRQPRRTHARELGGAVFGDYRFATVWIYHNG